MANTFQAAGISDDFRELMVRKYLSCCVASLQGRLENRGDAMRQVGAIGRAVVVEVQIDQVQRANGPREPRWWTTAWLGGGEPDGHRWGLWAIAELIRARGIVMVAKNGQL